MTSADFVAFAKKHPTGVVCLLLTLVCGLLLYFRSGTISVSQAEYEAKSTEATKMVNNVKAAPGLEEQLAEIQSLGKELDSRLMKANQLAVNLQYFYKLEADNGVKFLDVRQVTPARTRGPAPKTIFSPVPFTMTVQGTYDQLVKFLGELQTGRHLCRVGSAVFSKAAGAAGEGPAPQMTLALNVELLGQP